MKYPGKKISATLTLFSPLGQIHPLMAWPIFKYIQITLVLFKLRIAVACGLRAFAKKGPG
jgi:hypothetical protein